MLAYLILSRSHGEPIEAELIRRFENEVPAEVPFYPDERIVWRSQDGSCVFFGWQAFTEVAGIGSHWVTSERGLTAFSGHCWPRATGWVHGTERSWAQQLRDWLGDHPIDASIRESLFGHFTLISLASDGSGIALPDPANIDQLYLSGRDGMTAVSNRAGLCASAVNHESVTPERSLVGAGWLGAEGWMLDEETGYWDAQRPRAGSYVAFEAGLGCRLVELDRSPFLPADRSFSTYEELLREADLDLRQSLRAIAALPLDDRVLALSGGKDSRTLTALILDEGLQDRFQFVTHGSPEGAEVIAARQLANRFRLDWRSVDASERSAGEELESVRMHAGLREGMNSAWSTFEPPVFSPGATVSGVLGEVLRWGPVAMTGTGAADVDDMITRVQRRRPLDPMEIMRPDSRAYYQQVQRDLLRTLAEQESSMASVSTIYYHEVLARSRNGPDYTWSPRLRINPFLTPVCMRANHRLLPDARPDIRFHIDLQRACNIELSKLPLAESTWPEASIAHLPDAEDYRRIEPARPISPDGRAWRTKRYGDYRPLIERYLLDRENPIADLMLHERLADRLATGDVHGGRTRLIWGALTAAVWMGGHASTVKLSRGASSQGNDRDSRERERRRAIE